MRGVAGSVLAAICVCACGASSDVQKAPAPMPGYVGVQVVTITAQESAPFGLTGAAVVAATVAPDGPAYAAGLRDGDAVVSIDGQRVVDATVAAGLVLAHKAGDKVRMGIIHLMGDGRRVDVELGIVAAVRPEGYGNQAGGAPAQPAQGATTSRNAAGLRLVDPQRAITGQAIRQGHCTATAPQGWGMITNQQADAVDLNDPTRRAFVGWGIRGVNQAMQRFYGDLYGPPEIAVLAPVAMATRSNVDYTAPPSIVGGYFTARPFAAGNYIGVVLYHVYQMYPQPMQGQYILSSFYAYAERGAPDLLAVAKAVMMTVSCQTQLRPPEPSRPPGGSGGRTGNSERDGLKDYNSQLGTQWAHSSSGRNYLLDRATMWNDNGPDGPGFYTKNGNDIEKLTPGFGG